MTSQESLKDIDVLDDRHSRVTHEGAMTWLRRIAKRRSQAIVAVTLSLISIALLGTYVTQRWDVGSKAGSIRVYARNPMFLEVLRDSKEIETRNQLARGRRQLLYSIPVPTKGPVTLPAGDYRVRFAPESSGRPVYKMLVAPGQEISYLIQSPLDLWPAITPNHASMQREHWRTAVDLLDFRGRKMLFVRSDSAILLLDAATSEPRWSRDLGTASKSELPSILSYQVLPSTHDLSGDGIGDLILFKDDPAESIDGICAVSGSDGQKLWSALPEHWTDIPLVTDVNADGTADLLVSAITSGPERSITAISGSTGSVLWSWPIPHEWFVFAQEPSRQLYWDLRLMQENSKSEVLAPSELRLIQADPARVAFVAGNRLVQLSLAHGQVFQAPIELSFYPVRPPVFADLNGDGKDECLLFAPGMQEPQLTNKPRELWALQVETGQPLWKIVGDRWDYFSVENNEGYHRERPLHSDLSIFPWPVVTDLDSNGAPEIILPRVTQGSVFGLPEALDGATGNRLWMASIDAAFATALPGPDRDGDGFRELIVLANCDPPGTIFGVSEQIPILATVSGKDGTVISRANIVNARTNLEGVICPTSVSLLPGESWGSCVLVHMQDDYFVASSRSGGVLDAGHSTSEVIASDLNSDGVVEVLGVNKSDAAVFARPILGEEVWRRWGSWLPAEDFDADGVNDVVSTLQTQTLVACASGIDGRVLWSTSHRAFFFSVITVTRRRY